jgi:hypothetical protein
VNSGILLLAQELGKWLSKKIGLKFSKESCVEVIECKNRLNGIRVKVFGRRSELSLENSIVFESLLGRVDL